MCKLKPLLSRWLDEADSAQGTLPQVGGDKLNQQVSTRFEPFVIGYSSGKL
jgi:hypothetical protein